MVYAVRFIFYKLLESFRLSSTEDGSSTTANDVYTGQHPEVVAELSSLMRQWQSLYPVNGRRSQLVPLRVGVHLWTRQTIRCL